jgi:heme exporter protein D
MQATNHMDFIVAAYTSAIAIVGALTLWVMLDYRAQRRALLDLDSKGLTRRSAPGRAEPAMEQAKEKV